MFCHKPQTKPVIIKTNKAFGCANDIIDIYTEQGKASWYGGNGDGFAGNKTANCEIYDPLALTCAHRTLPFDTLVKVENIATGNSIILRVNDRGPFIQDRILDMSKRAAQELGLLHIGITTIRLQTVDTNGKPVPLRLAIAKGNPYTIQVASLVDPVGARRLSKELKTAFDQKVYQVKKTLNGTVVERVRIGTYLNFEQAEKARKSLAQFCKERNLEPFITRQQ
jgi:rare lipoprotein A